MSKRGRPRLPPERRRHARVTVLVTDECYGGLYLYAQRKRGDLSEVLSRLLERLADRERELSFHQKSESSWPIAR